MHSISMVQDGEVNKEMIQVKKTAQNKKKLKRRKNPLKEQGGDTRVVVREGVRGELELRLELSGKAGLQSTACEYMAAAVCCEDVMLAVSGNIKSTFFF